MPFQMTSCGVGLGQGSYRTERQTPIFLHTHAYSDHLTKTNIFFLKRLISYVGQALETMRVNCGQDKLELKFLLNQ